MANNDNIQKRWIENFNRYPLVNKDSRLFNTSIARQLIYGKTDVNHPEYYSTGFESVSNVYELDRAVAVETTTRYLHILHPIDFCLQNNGDNISTLPPCP
jgi:hypothetical protein